METLPDFVERLNPSVEVRGTATITREGREALSRRLSVRYLGPVNGNAYADRVNPGVVMRIEPEAIRAWDYTDETAPEPDTAARLIPAVVTRGA